MDSFSQMAGAVIFEDRGGGENPAKRLGDAMSESVGSGNPAKLGAMIFEAGCSGNLTKLMGDMIFEAGGSGNLTKLMEIKENLGDEQEYRRICNARSDYTGRRILHLAAEKGYSGICRFLIGKVKVECNIRTYREDTPLILAAKVGNVQIVKDLLKNGSDINMYNSEGYTPLHYAVKNGNMNLIKRLVKKNASLELDSVDGTPLQCAASRGDLRAVEILIEKGLADVDSLCTMFGSPLISAVESQSYDCVKFLLQRHANPNKKVYGLNAWAQAAKGSTEILHHLVDLHVEVQSKGYMAPIEHAAFVGNREGVELLFPLTKMIQHIPDWNVDGIMKYYGSSTSINKKCRRSRLHDIVDKANTKLLYGKYSPAAWYFTQAMLAEPTEPKWLAGRSRCLARLGYKVRSLHDEKECKKMLK